MKRDKKHGTESRRIKAVKKYEKLLQVAGPCCMIGNAVTKTDDDAEGCRLRPGNFRGECPILETGRQVTKHVNLP
jgi:hypothetical protein